MTSPRWRTSKASRFSSFVAAGLDRFSVRTDESVHLGVLVRYLPNWQGSTLKLVGLGCLVSQKATPSKSGHCSWRKGPWRRRLPRGKKDLKTGHWLFVWGTATGTHSNMFFHYVCSQPQCGGFEPWEQRKRAQPAKSLWKIQGVPMFLVEPLLAPNNPVSG